MAAIMNTAILNLAIFDSSILVCPLKLTHNLPRLVPTICTKKLLLFILTQLGDGSHLEFCHIGFRHLVIFFQICSKTLSLHSDSDSNKFNLTQSHSFWLNLMIAAILNSAILVAILHKKTSLIHSDSTWWWQPYWILPWLIQTPCFLLWDSLKNTLSLHSDSDSN